MMNKKYLIILATVIAMGGSVYAQDAVDQASNYSSGSIATLDQGTGWTSQSPSLFALAGTATFEAQNATSEGGSALMNTGGLTWVLTATSSGSMNFQVYESRIYREVSSASHQTGEQILIKVQVPIGPASGEGGLSVDFKLIPGLTTFIGLNFNTSSGDWEIQRNGGTETINLSAGTPYQVLVTNNGASANVQFTNLTNSTSQDWDVTPISTGNLGRVEARVSVLDGFNPSSGLLLLNEMKYNAGGGLPVELDYFMVE